MSCLNGIITLIKKLDFVSPEVKLRTYGEPRFKTIFGGIISLIMIVAVVSLATYFLKIMFNRELIWVTYNEHINIDPSFNFTSYPFYFYIADKLGFMIKDMKSVFDIKAQLSSVNSSINNSYANNTNLSLINCDFDNRYFCLSSKYPILLSHRDDDSYTKLSINFSLAENMINLNNSVFNEFYLVLKYTEFFIDNLNTSSAGQQILTTEKMFLSNQFFKKFTFIINQIVHNTDVGYVFFDHIEDQFHTFEPMRETILYKEYNENLAIVEFKISNKLGYYKRIYFKFQDILAHVGGIIESAIFFCLIIENYLAQKIIYCSLGNDLISFDSKSPRKASIFHNSHKNTLSFYDKQKESPTKKSPTIKINNFIGLDEDGKNNSSISLEKNEKLVESLNESNTVPAFKM